MSDNQDFAKNVVEKIKKVVSEGNASRILIWHDGRQISSFPVNAGVLGGVLLAAAAPWALIIAAIAAVGTNCCIEVEKKDGSIINIYGKR
jgi:hypothetical protein